ncbi:hypothetical protein SO802_009747 [Lithocarpus litseifolius]|uniref:Uncharacterized protein n=1 Tax=Lithocarpus litseifolius TaxID=425828 RepID=A0AAW2DGE0_9ROSI
MRIQSVSEMEMVRREVQESEGLKSESESLKSEEVELLAREVEHAIHIQRWANKGQLLADALTLDEDMTYLAAYMEWYRRMTRRFRYVQPPEVYAGYCRRVELSGIGERECDDEELKGDWDMYVDGTRSLRCMFDAVAAPSHPVGHDDSAEHTSHAQAGPRSPLPTRLSPPLFSGSTHESGCIFVPIPGRLTLPVVQAEPTQEPSLPNPEESAAQIERSENIELVHGL